MVSYEKSAGRDEMQLIVNQEEKNLDLAKRGDLKEKEQEAKLEQPSHVVESGKKMQNDYTKNMISCSEEDDSVGTVNPNEATTGLQKWDILKLNDNDHVIRNHANGLYLTGTNEESIVKVSEWENSPYQMWSREGLCFVNKATSLALDTTYGGGAYTVPKHGQPFQRWHLVD